MWNWCVLVLASVQEFFFFSGFMFFCLCFWTLMLIQCTKTMEVIWSNTLLQFQKLHISWSFSLMSMCYNPSTLGHNLVVQQVDQIGKKHWSLNSFFSGQRSLNSFSFVFIGIHCSCVWMIKIPSGLLLVSYRREHSFNPYYDHFTNKFNKFMCLSIFLLLSVA